jgi:hypothetical protein
MTYCGQSDGVPVTIWAVLGWFALAGASAVLAGGLLWLLIFRRHAAETVDDSWEFSLENYDSMNRFLAEEDLVFLRAQRGYRPEMDVRWRQERYRLFRLYLSELKFDFRRLHAKARALVAYSDAESADLVGVLMRQEVTFLWALAGLEFQLLLYRTGVGGIRIAPFLELIEAMRMDLDARTVPHAA